MITREQNERLTRIDGDAPMGRLMRENYWIPFALSSHLVHGEAPTLVRLFGQNYVAFRAQDGRIGFLDELCPHRRTSLTLGRIEGNGVRCIYHGWKIDVSGCVAEAPTQLVRPEQFAARVRVVHFPVREAGGLAWVWLGAAEAPAFPELPWTEDDTYWYWCASRVPCNWLQGVEGTIDSAHVGFLHQTWHRETAKRAEHANLGFALDQPPSYKTEATPYGMRAAAVRQIGDGRAYVRITEHFMPLVTVVPVGRIQPRDGSMFVISPVDDTHHLLFFGYFSDTPKESVEDLRGMTAPDYVPDPSDYAGLRGDRANRWGQDRALMDAGHFTGFARNLLEEDAAVQTSMGAILDRTQENLSSGDVAVAHARQMLLDALLAAEAGRLPPGSARSRDAVRMPNALEVVVEAGARWEDAAQSQLAS
jgi:phenylpropionate dioxygenase-like ring-hydroxylating dioxygenase large terminal subunit